VDYVSDKTVYKTWGLSLAAEGICVVILSFLNILSVEPVRSLTIPLCILIIIFGAVMCIASLQLIKRNKSKNN